MTMRGGSPRDDDEGELLGMTIKGEAAPGDGSRGGAGVCVFHQA